MVEPHALFEQAVGAVVLGLEAAAALVILLAGARALLRYLARTFLPREGQAAHRPLRHEFGRSLLLALDFAVGSDMLAVAIAPTLESVAIAGLVVLVRIALTLVLEYELREERRAGTAADAGARTRAGGGDEAARGGGADAPGRTPRAGT